jgi:cardiolipin synthase A/B
MTNFLNGNYLKLLRNGSEYFPALEAAIDQAQQEIFLESYIYQNDAIGKRIANALKKAAKRGVNVYVLLDAFGSQAMPTDFRLSLQSAGIHLMFYRPQISPWTFKKNRLRRLHRKLVVIDGKIGFLGGINIIDDNNVPENGAPRVDYAVEIRGQLLAPMLKTVQHLWRRLAWLQLKKTPKGLVKAYTKLDPQYQKVQAALVLRDNVLHRRDIEQAYLDAIATAQDAIWIANSYFVPGWRFRKALIEAASRGVKVTLLLQGRIEYWVMLATQAFYGQLLKNGVRIYEYRKSFMHSKVAVIDDIWATVGSSNIDPFSLLLAREANVVVRDADFARALKSSLQASIRLGAVRVNEGDWSRKKVGRRFLSWMVYGFIRFVLGMIGRAEDWRK